MIGRLYELVIDCPAPQELAAFYRELTGLDELHSSPEWVTLGRGNEVRLAFQQASDHQQPRWPDPSGPQQMHLDVFVVNLDEAQERVLALGAKPLKTDAAEYRVYADPAGHPFCLCLEDPNAP